MKRVIMSMLLMLAVTGISFAQEPQVQTKPAKPELTEEQKAKIQERKEMFEIRTQIIKEELKLTDEQFEKFVPIYRNYCRVKQFNTVKHKKIDWETATKQEMNEVIKANLDNVINTAMVRKSYILLFEEAISPKQVSKLYKVENNLSKKAREEYKKRKAQ